MRGRLGVVWMVGPVLLFVACTGGSDVTSGHVGSSASMAPAAMQLRPVEAVAAPGSKGYDTIEPTCGGLQAPCTPVVLLDGTGITLANAQRDLYTLGPLIADGGDVATASAARSGEGWSVIIKLAQDGTAALATATSDLVSAKPPRDRIAIVVSGAVISAPTVAVPITDGSVQVTGGLTEDRARALVAALNGS
jgi:hypothetical protein